jgi:hypothetical protein
MTHDSSRHQRRFRSHEAAGRTIGEGSRLAAAVSDGRCFRDGDLAGRGACIAILPKGRRKLDLQRAADKIFATVFPQRVLPFDEAAASAFAELVTVRRRKGLTFDALDVQIAAIAKSRGMTIATRNVNDFEDSGIDIINPWGD